MEVPVWKLDLPAEHAEFLSDVLPLVAGQTNLTFDQIALLDALQRCLSDGRTPELSKFEWTILDDAMQCWATGSEPLNRERCKASNGFGHALDKMLGKPATGTRREEVAVKAESKQKALF